MGTKGSVKLYFFLVVLLSLAIAVTIRFPMVLAFLFEADGGRHGMPEGAGMSRMIVELAFTFFTALAMFTMNYFLIRPMEVHGDLKPHRVVLALLLTLLAVFIMSRLFFFLYFINESGPVRRGHRSEFFLINFFVSSLVVGCVFLIRLIFQKQNYKLEMEALKREAIQGRFESLKNQLSPHFLFNSLTALKMLISESPEKAQLYVDSLSKALRYTLRGKEQLVTLREEMEFMEAYLYLIRMRYESNLIIKIDISEALLNRKLPPLTVQTLVENAIKHNEISKRKPLRIEIRTLDDNNLQVSNPIQKKLTEEEGTGFGLTNLSKQFQMLIGRDIRIHQEQGNFIVEIPLIRP
jgi:sensor histidine kinase YesM